MSDARLFDAASSLGPLLGALFVVSLGHRADMGFSQHCAWYLR